MLYDVFISYSSDDKKVVEGLCAYLEQHKIRCFVAYRDIPIGKPWANAVVEALDQSRMMLVVFSENFNRSTQVDREIEIASEDQKPILTFRITNTHFEGCKKYYLKNINWIDAFPNPAQTFGLALNAVEALLSMPHSTNKGGGTPSLPHINSENRHPRRHIYWMAIAVVFAICIGIVVWFILPNNTIQPDMVFVKGGEFVMGDSVGDGHPDEHPAHKVTISDFYIGRYEVTQAEWVAVMGNNPSRFKGDNLPVDNVSWNDIQEFLLRLNQQTGKKYRLPTEAEWEFAARGGIYSRNYKYSGSDDISDVAWYCENAGGQPHPVGLKRNNELMLYDMCGNVWEWCQDWYEPYSDSDLTVSPLAERGMCRILRGGGWTQNAWQSRVSLRDGLPPDCIGNSYGFRLAMEPF